MKWLCNVLSWYFTCLAVALLSLLVGSFVLNAKVKANSPATYDPYSTVCGGCQGASIYGPGYCPTINGLRCPNCTLSDPCP